MRAIRNYRWRDKAGNPTWWTADLRRGRVVGCTIAIDKVMGMTLKNATAWLDANGFLDPPKPERYLRRPSGLVWPNPAAA